MVGGVQVCGGGLLVAVCEGVACELVVAVSERIVFGFGVFGLVDCSLVFVVRLWVIAVCVLFWMGLHE